MKQYQPVEIVVMSLKPQDVLTVSYGGQYVVGGNQEKLDFGASQYD